ncbi:2,3-bisphosphoglycerate-dependent phosphoglycerate mutase, partial [Vibrio parahaemolyticus]|nr:2,3-bisphosphoglycerate-dependent phosphoglycerate mutase [Vibrio parahaemolyticus]
WQDEIAPALKDNKTVLVAAHGNSLRALAKHIEGISDEDIMDLEIPTGQPLVYELNDDLTVAKKYYL